MDSVDIIFPEHEDVVLYSHHYGYWDIDEEELNRDIENAGPRPEGSGDIRNLFDKIVADGEYVTLHNEEDCDRFVKLATQISEEFEFDIIITKRARCIDAEFTLPYGLSEEYFIAFIDLLKLSHNVLVMPKEESNFTYKMSFCIETEHYRKHSKPNPDPAKAIALEHGYDHPEVKKRFKEALREFNPSLSESKIDFIIWDLLDVTDFSSPTIRKKSLAAIAVGFYRACYLHTGCYSDESIRLIKYKGLIPEPNALDAVAAARQEIQTQKDIAYKHLDALVDAVIAFAITDAEKIEKILDELSEWCDDDTGRFLELDKKLCRHIYLNYPQLVKHETLFKARFMGPDEYF